MARYPTAFAERNKVVIAVVGIVALAATFLVTFNADSLPGLRGDTHTAVFAESGGLRAGNEVRVAGVRVGEVTEVSLAGRTVEVDFRVKGVELGDESTAAVKVKTMLGQKYLAVDPLGDEPLEGPIALADTSTPYDVNAAFSDLSTTIDEIDTAQLEESFEALSAAFADTPESVRGIVRGLTGLSRTISSRDTELAELFASTNSVTRTLEERNDEFARIIQDGSALLDELAAREQAVKKMLAGTARLGVELRGLVKDNEETLRPALAKLDKVSAILARNQANLDKGLSALGPYYRVLASASGNGHWLDSYVCGLFDAAGAPLLDKDAERNCTPKGGRR